MKLPDYFKVLVRPISKTVSLEPIYGDLIEVVRCKYCKHCDIGTDEEGKPFIKCLNGRTYGGTTSNWFCADGEREKRMTNGDKIRQMSDEELANKIVNGDCFSCFVESPTGDDCHQCALDWLKEEEE